MSSSATLAAALLGFFSITMDAVVVNVALPSIGNDLNTGVSGLQWIVDGYTLMFAALLLSGGSLSDRIGPRRAFFAGIVGFVSASASCGLAPDIYILVASRFIQGLSAAIVMPSSMALIHNAFTLPLKRARSVSIWAIGGSVATTSGPLLGGILSSIDWRLIFFINLPVGFIILLLLRYTPESDHVSVPIDLRGQILAIIAMIALIYGVIEAGVSGLASFPVAISLVFSMIFIALFLESQRKSPRPMVPSTLLRSSSTLIAALIGFTFMFGYFGLPFVMSLYLQQIRGLPPFATGEIFVPMMLIGLVLTPLSARLSERFGARRLIFTGLISMSSGLIFIAMLPESAPIWQLSTLMILVGLSGPLASPPTTAILLNSVPADQSGTASGIYNASRQTGAALAVALFGALLGQSSHFMNGLMLSLFIATGVSLLTAVISLKLH